MRFVRDTYLLDAMTDSLFEVINIPELKAGTPLPIRCGECGEIVTKIAGEGRHAFRFAEGWR